CLPTHRPTLPGPGPRGRAATPPPLPVASCRNRSGRARVLPGGVPGCDQGGSEADQGNLKQQARELIMAGNADKVIVTNVSALKSKYGAQGLTKINAAVKQFITADK